MSEMGWGRGSNDQRCDQCSRRQAFPFVFFGGDGACLATALEDSELTCNAMARTASWVRGNLDLDLHVGMASIKEAHDAGYDV